MSHIIQSTSVPSERLAALDDIATRVRWIATAIVDAANRGRLNESGVKVGGHQASSASMVEIMVSLWFSELDRLDRVSVKPHASPVLHAINYLLGDLDRSYLPTLRAQGGLQSYPSRLKDPDTVDFSTGSVGIGATAALWAAVAHRYIRSHFPSAPPAGRFVSLLGDAELDEGAIWEAVADPSVASLGELLWIVDLNRQSLDRVVPDVQIHRMAGMFEAAGWQVITLKWGGFITEIFSRRGGAELRARLEQMPNEEFQRILRVNPEQIAERIIGAEASAPLRALLDSLTPAELARAVRDLGGHDIRLLLETYEHLDDERPTVIFAYTSKGRGLPTEGHPNNHSALLSGEQMQALAVASGADLDDPWATFDHDTAAARLCAERRGALAREEIVSRAVAAVPTQLSRPHRAPISTQASFGRFIAEVQRAAPAVADRIVTCSPDVASSTNLGGWINKTGVWSAVDRHDWFADDTERLLKWSEVTSGQHIELGIAEVNLVGLLSELGTTWSRWGEPLIPIATIYDPFIPRALEPWAYGMYAGGQSIIVGTPSGVTLAPEGGAHQSVTTPSIGLEQPGCIAWEPAFAQDLEWCMLAAMSRVGINGGTSAYFRLSTRPVDQSLAAVPSDPESRERRRRGAIAGGYRLSEHDPSTEDVVLVGVGAMMPEVVAAAGTLAREGIVAGVVCLTSPDLVFRALDARGGTRLGKNEELLETLLPGEAPAPVVTVLDGHPHTLAFLAGVRGDRIRCLGVRDFGQSSSLPDAHRLHGIDAASITTAARALIAHQPPRSAASPPQATAPQGPPGVASSGRLTIVVEIDLSAVTATLGNRHGADSADVSFRTSYLTAVTAATVEGLRRNPRVGYRFEAARGFVAPATECLGLAVDTPSGRATTVIADAGRLSLPALTERIDALFRLEHVRPSDPAASAEATFTITDAGSAGVLVDTPILPPRHAAALTLGTVERRPVVVATAGEDERIEVRTMAHLALAYDRRSLEPADAAQYLRFVKDRLRDPAAAQ